jgi:hypothetical protein
MDFQKSLWKASTVFAPDFPRQVSSGTTIQERVDRQVDFCESLEQARENGMPGYYSVYSFPRGHSKDGKIPKVDCVFIDLDIPGDDYDPEQEKTGFDAWEREMSALLARARMIASAIIESDSANQDNFRVVLSGHKGLHIYLDFPTISTNNGDFHQFKNGLKSYGDNIMSWLDSIAGGVNIDSWVDVDASDLGRLARHPNTVHHGAEYDDTERWCVPITMEELSELRVEDYLDYTESPRWISGYSRNPSENAGEKVVQAIRTASSTGSDYSNNGSSDTSYHDSEAVSNYGDRVNEEITLEDVAFLTSNKPCIEAFRNRDDAFNHGNASHLMELNIIGRFVEMGVPRDVIHNFFSTLPGYRQDYTDKQIDEAIGREYREFNCNKIAERAGMFCLGDGCSVYQRNDDIQK